MQMHSLKCITTEIMQIVLLRFLSAPSLSDLSIATDGQKSHVSPASVTILVSNVVLLPASQF